MRVLGIDPGLRRCGFAVLERRDRVTRPVSYGTVVTGAGPVATRLAELAERLRTVIRDHQPDVAAIEQLFVNRNLRTVMTVGQASGVALLVAAESGLLIASYTPTQIKVAVTGSGNAPKSQVGFMVKAMVGLPAPARPADSADAIAVALCHLQHTDSPHPEGAPVSVEDEWLRRAAPTSPSLASKLPARTATLPRPARTPLPPPVSQAAPATPPAATPPAPPAPSSQDERGRHERGDAHDGPAAAGPADHGAASAEQPLDPEAPDQPRGRHEARPDQDARPDQQEPAP